MPNDRSKSVSASDEQLLQASIQLKHNCKAAHVETVSVDEIFHGEHLWAGQVEIFELKGHPTARRCYAWAERMDDIGVRYITVLHKGLVISAGSAVKAWLVSCSFDRQAGRLDLLGEPDASPVDKRRDVQDLSLGGGGPVKS